MFGKSAFLALAFVASLMAPVKSLAQDAGVSGIPHGPGSAGGLNNSVNDPSGIGNAARIQPPPSPRRCLWRPLRLQRSPAACRQDQRRS